MAERHFWAGWPVALRWAVGLSLAIHLFVIFPLGWVFYTPIAMPQAPLSAVLKGPGEVTQAARAAAKRWTPVSRGDAATTNKPALKPLPQQAQAPTPQRTAAPVLTTTAGVAQADSAAQANAASRVGTVGGAPESARDGVEADALNRYRLALGVAARKARRYPEVSRTRGQEGTAEVFVLLSRTGGAPQVVTGKSSGSATLDEGALVMMRVAVERTPVPQELQSRSVRIPMKIRFSLDDF